MHDIRNFAYICPLVDDMSAHRIGIINSIDKEIARMENTEYTRFLISLLVDRYIQDFFDDLSDIEKSEERKRLSLAVCFNLGVLEEDFGEKYREKEEYFYSENVQKYLDMHIKDLGLEPKKLWHAVVCCAELAPRFICNHIPSRKPSFRDCTREALKLPVEQLDKITLAYKSPSGKVKSIVYDIGSVPFQWRVPLLEQIRDVQQGISNSNQLEYKVPAVEWKPKHKNDKDEVTKLVAFTTLMRMVVRKFRTGTKGNMMRLIAALAHIMGYLPEKYLKAECRNKRGKVRRFDSDQELHSLIKNKTADFRFLCWSGLFEHQKVNPRTER